MEPSFRILYYGGILPDFDPLLVRHRFQGLYRLTPEKATLVFSGRKIVLRRGLDARELPRYYTYLRGLGLQVFAEREAAVPRLDFEVSEDAPTPPADAKQTPPTPPPRGEIEFVRRTLVVENNASADATVMAPIDAETCPRCGEIQYRRTLCQFCGADMPRLRAAQKARVEEARATFATGSGPAGEAAGPFLWRPGGRIGRRHYLALCAIGSLILMLGCAASLWFVTSLPLLLACMPAAAVVLFATALRLHDLNTTGWMAPAVLVPWAGFIIGIVLLATPGSVSGNRYGAAPASLGWGRAFGFLLMMCGGALLLCQLTLIRAHALPVLIDWRLYFR